MPYKVTLIQTKPTMNHDFFLMPQLHIDEVEKICQSMNGRVLDFSYEQTGLKLTTTRTFADAASYQEFLDKSNDNEVIIKARNDRMGWNELYKIVEETIIETI
jgi:hypothetical protein